MEPVGFDGDDSCQRPGSAADSLVPQWSPSVSTGMTAPATTFEVNENSPQWSPSVSTGMTAPATTFEVNENSPQWSPSVSTGMTCRRGTPR